MQQTEIICLEDLVKKSHNYRKFANVFNFKKIETDLKKNAISKTYEGYGIQRLFKCLLLQFMENLSDREMQKFMEENTAAKWFCGFGLTEKTPDFSVFSRVRNRIGTKTLSEIFSELKNQMKDQGFMSETFTFIDASHLVSKAALWEERDKAIKAKEDEFNNKNSSKYTHDKQAKTGCKGGTKFWFGYKKHVSVDMQSGLINKVAVTPANVTDSKGLKHVSPSSGAVFADKGYCGQKAEEIVRKKGAELRAIKKNNMRGKNRDLDRWISKMRSPYERVFSQQSRRVRYVGVAKNQFAEFMNAICFNIKRMSVLREEYGVLTG